MVGKFRQCAPVAPKKKASAAESVHGLLARRYSLRLAD
jgi:hypothetical protein